MCTTWAYNTYCDVPGSPCLSKTGPVVGPYFLIFGSLCGVRIPGHCLVAAWSQGGLLETPPCWHLTIYTSTFEVWYIKTLCRFQICSQKYRKWRALLTTSLRWHVGTYGHFLSPGIVRWHVGTYGHKLLDGFGHFLALLSIGFVIFFIKTLASTLNLIY